MITLSVILRFVPFNLYISALAAGVPGVDPATLIAMRMKRIPQDKIVMPLIFTNKAGVRVTVNQLETHYLARGNVHQLAMALIFAKRAGIPLEFEKAAAIDLSGANVLEAVQMAVNPKVVELPPMKVVTKDGLETETYVKVTLRSNIDNFVGANESTLTTKLSRDLSIAIASADGYQTLADDPSKITHSIVTSGYDETGAFEIVSIDVNGIMPLHSVKQ